MDCLFVCLLVGCINPDDITGWCHGCSCIDLMADQTRLVSGCRSAGGLRCERTAGRRSQLNYLLIFTNISQFGHEAAAVFIQCDVQ